MSKTPQDVWVEDDEWVTIAWKNQREKCCGCGKVHRVDYRVVDGKLQFKATGLRK